MPTHSSRPSSFEAGGCARRVGRPYAVRRGSWPARARNAFVAPARPSPHRDARLRWALPVQAMPRFRMRATRRKNTASSALAVVDFRRPSWQRLSGHLLVLQDLDLRLDPPIRSTPQPRQGRARRAQPWSCPLRRPGDGGEQFPPAFEHVILRGCATSSSPTGRDLGRFRRALRDLLVSNPTFWMPTSDWRPASSLRVAHMSANGRVVSVLEGV